MIFVDTNVLSELMRPAPAPQVIAWLDAQEPTAVAVTAITVAELLYGIERLPEGKRKRTLAEAVGALFDEEFYGRILSFDTGAALHYARITAARANAGHPISMANAQIAAICLHHGAGLATRNGKDFADLGLSVINPWMNGHN